jgi:N-acetyl-gamma-glutamyl-phosphate reductase
LTNHAKMMHDDASMGATAAVLGASGYSGTEIVRLLAGHPALEVGAVSGDRRVGTDLGEVSPSLAGSDLRLVGFEEAAATGADVCFSCLPQGALRDRVGQIRCGVLVDLSDDHRAADGWVYGLTEFQRDSVHGATRIANPGCYPTAALLCLVPFARAGLLSEVVVIDAMSGVSGAGRKTEDRLLFGSLEGNLTAYGSGVHRHVPEMERALAALGGIRCRTSFTPHLVPTVRGLLVTARSEPTREIDSAGALSVLQEAYVGEPFVRVIADWPQTKSVAGSNGAHVSARVDENTGLLVCSAAIDNLGKGAAGQAVQNANLALGLDETAGLTGIGVWP